MNNIIYILITMLYITSASAYDKVRVVDGDTLWINGVKARLFAVDAPEKKQSCREANGNTYSCGLEAELMLRRAAFSKDFYCTIEGAAAYNRVLTICYVGGDDVSELLLLKGLVVIDHEYMERYKKRPYFYDRVEGYIKAEEDAKKHNRGLWGAEFTMPWNHKSRRERKK